MDGRKRTVQIKFRVTEEEHRIIEQRMKLVPTRNMAAYRISTSSVSVRVYCRSKMRFSSACALCGV